jgi:hypothetical protein
MSVNRAALWILSLLVFFCFGRRHVGVVYPLVYAWSQSVAPCADFAELCPLYTIAELTRGANISEENIIYIILLFTIILY